MSTSLMVLSLLFLSLICTSCSSDNIFSLELFTNSQEKKFIVLPVYLLGLANRLRTVSSMYSIAKVTNRHLVVIWVPSEECNAGD